MVLNPLPIPTHIVSVRTLVEFVLQEGDLTPAIFQKRDRAQAGTLGHRQVQRSRPRHYAAEVEIAYRVDAEDLRLEILGRIDGVFSTARPPIIEEIKTTTLALNLVTEQHNPLHWAQAQCYAYMYARQYNLQHITIHLTYYHLDSRAEKTFARHFDLPQLENFFTALVTPYLNWIRQIKAWRTLRDQSIHQLDFPYAGYRPGQRDLAVAVYKTIKANQRLFGQAPTGVGKTIATLFPAVKAVGMGLVAKIFYLTAKTPGRIVAEIALDDMRRAGLHFKSVTLTAKEKICFCPGANCDPELCVYARNYFGKVKMALAETGQVEAFSREVIIELAQQYEICPFEFSLDLALWVDCIIGDYNYAFDPRVYLRRFFDFSTEPYVFLIDEAHNLPDRARAMFSAELDKQAVLALRRTLKPHLPELAHLLSVINRVLLDKRKACVAAGAPALVEQERPEDLLQAVGDFCEKAEEWLALNRPAEFREELLEFYFLGNAYLRTAEYFDTFYVSYFEKQGQADLKAKLFCLDPAPLLAAALERCQSAIFFSATLLPMDYFEQLLTGVKTNQKLVLPSPFPPENISLLIHNRISTKYAQRAGSYQAVAAAIETVCAAQPGNYLVFFPSYAYLAAVLELVKERVPEQQLLVQNRGMTEQARESFLARFSAGNEGTLIGFAVMGGIFAEGIDLVGERLIGAVVVGVGLPQLGLEQDLIKDYFDRQNRHGFAYAYQYPGFNRVLQATGRVIRTEVDRGVIVLIDERFTHSRYRRLFPPPWRQFQVVQSGDDITGQLARFWVSP